MHDTEPHLEPAVRPRLRADDARPQGDGLGAAAHRDLHVDFGRGRPAGEEQAQPGARDVLGLAQEWLAAESEEEFGQGIENIDAQTLRSRKQILFVVSAGNGHCLDIFVFGNEGQDKKPIWRLNELPEGGGICHERMLPYPTAYVRPQGDVIVQVPTEAAWMARKKDDPDSTYPISTALMTYTYRWNGTAYKLAAAQKVVTYYSATLNPEKCTMVEPCVE